MRKEDGSPRREDEGARVARQRILTAARLEHSRPSQARPADRPKHSPLAFSPVAFRRFSPVVVPVLLGAGCMAILLPLAISAPTTMAIGVDALGSILLVYAAAGVLLAAALAYAPNETLWALMMVLGLGVFGVITVAAIFGPIVGLALIIGLGALVGAVIRRQHHLVLEHTVHVMVLFGKYHRTLWPGFNLRWPGEQLLTIIPTAEITRDSSIADVVMYDGTHVDAVITIGFQANPARAAQLAARGHDWQDQVVRMAEITLRDTLREMRFADVMNSGEADPGAWDGSASLAARLRGRLRLLIGAWGVETLWVRPSELRPVRAMTMPSAKPMRGVIPDALLPLPPAMRGTTPAPPALAEAYNAVRERRINDPQTIARIADAFAAAANDPTVSPHLPFDAAQAASLLRHLVQQAQTT